MSSSDKITDRAKRYRANRVHTKRKRCEECGSKRNLGVGHRDGDEANNRPSNFFTQCKSCNGKQAARDKRMGRGVRTRQYNPENTRRMMANLSKLAQQAAKRGDSKTFNRHLRTLKMLEAEARKKNPGATNLAQYVQAAVDHTRGAHDEGGRVIHETPKSKRKEFAREIAFRKGYRSNPASAASALYKQFHGRGPDKIYEMQVAGVDPYGGHPELTSLGPLIRFIVGEDVVLGGEFGDEVQEAEWVREISFVPSVARWHDWLERIDPPTAEAKAKLREYKTPDLAAVPNTRHLYILGRQDAADATLISLGSDPEKDLLDLGFVYLIEYFTQKRFDRFEPINYFHHFGETSGVTPRLIYDRANKLLSLAGGEYKVTPRGIEN
jgi:hypothetical protein